MTRYREDRCAELAAGIIDPHGLADVLGGEIPWQHVPGRQPIPEDLHALEYRCTPIPDAAPGTCTVEHFMSPASRFANIVCDIADWFEYRVSGVPGVDTAGLVDGLRRFAEALTAEPPDYPGLAADLDTLGWLIDRAYDVYEDYQEDE